MAAKFTVRPITQQQASSYERRRPNGIGVTALAAVNGKGAYQRRFGAEGDRRVVYLTNRSKGRKSARYRRNRAVGEWNRELVARERKAQVKRSKSRGRRASTQRRHRARVYAGRYRALGARVGKKTYPTFVYKAGKYQRRIPFIALLGYRTKAQYEAALKDPKKAAQIEKRMARIEKRRTRRIDAIKQGRDPFVANRRSSSMSKRKGKGKRKKASGRGRRASKMRRVSLYVANKRGKGKRGRGRGRAAANFRRGKFRAGFRMRPRTKRASALVTIRARAMRRGGAKLRIRTSYRRNSFGGQYAAVLVPGLVGLGGFAVHRGGASMLDKYVLQKSTTLADPATTLGKLRPLLGALAVAAVGIPVAGAALPADQRMNAQVGMALSVGYTGLKTLLAFLGQDSAIQALSGIERGGGIFGEYFPVRDAAGYGEYFPVQMQGFGGFGQVTQAAAGFGQVTQAAAGLDGYRFQAMAGAHDPMMQAAAGTFGEYYATPNSDLRGYGEYEYAGPPAFDPNQAVDDGIAPNVDAAEVALRHAEALASPAADCGAGVDTWIPDVAAVAITDDGSDGCRVGPFEGRGGIFAG